MATLCEGCAGGMPDMDIERVQDVGLSGREDPAILAWAAQETRILLTHDVRTITRFAYDRVREGCLCREWWKSRAGFRQGRQ
jgi:hypothetical protein